MTEKISAQIYNGQASVAAKYREFSVGQEGLLFFIYFEVVTTLLRNLPGALGLFLRSLTYKRLFKKTGKGVVFGTNITIRNPKNIEIGDHVVVDDSCVLDAKGAQCDGISIGGSTFVSRNVVMACKNGGISIGRETSIGPNCIIHSIDKSKVNIGNCAAIAANCYIIGGPDYKSDRTDIPMIKQGFHEGKSISIGEDVWLGAGAYILDGSHIGKGTIIGAKSMVKGNIPDFSVAVGVPAIVKKKRGARHE